jgi:hypothetical protein
MEQQDAIARASIEATTRHRVADGRLAADRKMI